VGINQGLAAVSSDFMIAALLIYSLGVLAFAGDFAFGRPKRAAAAKAAVESRVAELATVGVGAVSSSGSSAEPPTPAPAGPGGPSGPGSPPASALPARRQSFSQAIGEAGAWVRAAVALSVAGVTAHLAAVVTRGFAVHRAPWGNMYEFVMAITCAAVIAFLLLLIRFRVYSVGLFLMAPIVLALGLCATVLYTAAGPLVPALHSYWIWIHVTTMTVAIGSYIVAAVLTVLYLIADRHTRRNAAESRAGFGAVLHRLPPSDALDRLSYRTVMFAFPMWTFGIIAGAIWADQAWGRYWGWDPTETWAFITWVVYACFLHARSTAGWRGRKAAVIQLIGFCCLAFNMVGVSLFITGLHSYAGLN
jgi:cytochrome c-type biogenesis protein CcsB